MATEVVSGLQTNWIGVVTGAFKTSVLDAGDIVGKADKSYIDQVQRILTDSIKKEGNERVTDAKTLKDRIESLNTSLAAKADKTMVQQLLAETALTRVRADLESVLSSHINKIHEACVVEHKAIEKDIGAFRNAAADAGEELRKKLQPVQDHLQALGDRVGAIAADLSTIQPLQQKIQDLRKAVADIEQHSSLVANLVAMNRESLEKLIADQLNVLMPSIIEHAEKHRKKKQTFFARLFSR
jgi:hypothetical protein